MCKIMIVEDNRHIRKLFKSILLKRGYEIIDVEDGEKAIRIYDSLEKKPEIIVVDYRLPKLNGLELTHEILTRDPSSRILMITGDPRINKTAIQESGIIFKMKPIKTKELITEIDLLNTEIESHRVGDGFPQTSGKNRILVRKNEIGFELEN